jgi:FkbM family methyltransferase
MSVENQDSRPFRHYTVKHRVVAWISQNLFDNITYTSRHGLLKGMKRRGGLGWLPEFMEPAVTPEHTFWLNHDLKGLVVYDIGAFHGLLTLLFARTARQVISYEPNTKNHARLTDNLGVNGVKNVTVRKVGLGSEVSDATMVASALTPGGATIESGTVDALVHSNLRVVSEQVHITTLDDDIRENSLPTPDFIKIDVEGAELPVLVGARKTLLTHKPQLFLEIHGETMDLKRKNVAAVVACLNDLGYDNIGHIESGTTIRSDNSAVAAQGHLYCR